MARDLRFTTREAAGGATRAMVVFLHGYGADGADLMGLAEPLAPHLPGVTFVAPDAPEPCAGNPAGRQWFSIPWLDGSSEAQARAGIGLAMDDLDAFIDQRLEAAGLAPEALALVGFSQGTMMALAVAPRRPVALAGVVGFSGRLLSPETFAASLRSRPPVALIHGDSDPVVTPDALPEAARTLAAAGIEAVTHVSPGTAHGIAPDGLVVALDFLKRHLPA